MWSRASRALDARWRRPVRRWDLGARSVHYPAAAAAAAAAAVGAVADWGGLYGRRVCAVSAAATGDADNIRGRISAVNSVFIGASNELGEFESGVTAGWFGLVPVVLPGGALTLGVTAVWMWRLPTLRTMDRFPTAATHSAAKH